MTPTCSIGSLVRFLRLVAVSVLFLGAAGVDPARAADADPGDGLTATSATAAPPAVEVAADVDPAAASDGVPVLLIHGYPVFSSSGACSEWLALRTFLQLNGRRSVFVLGYYKDGIPSACDLSLPPADRVDADTPLDEVARRVARFIWTTFTQHGLRVDIVAHSLGGLVVRSAVDQAGSGGVPAIAVEDVVTLGTAHQGLREDNFFVWNCKTRQCSDAMPGSAFLQALGHNPHSGGTRWTYVAGDADDIVRGPSAIDADHDGTQPYPLRRQIPRAGHGDLYRFAAAHDVAWSGLLRTELAQQDLCRLDLQSPASRMSTLECLSRESTYVNAGFWGDTAFHTLADSDLSRWRFEMADVDADRNLDLCAVILQGPTGSGRVEAHCASGAHAYARFAIQVPTVLAFLSEGDLQRWRFDFADVDVDRRADLCGLVVHPPTGSNHTELHCLSAASNFQTYVVHAVTPLALFSPTDIGRWRFDLVDADSDRRPDLCSAVLQAPTGSGRVEVHCASAASGFTQWVVQLATGLSLLSDADLARWRFGFVDLDDDGKTDLCGMVLAPPTGSGFVELHCLYAVYGFGQFGLQTPLGPFPTDDILYRSTFHLATSSLGVTRPVPRRAPDPPAAVRVEVDDRDVVVRWEAPPRDGGSSVVTYRVTAQPGGASRSVGGTRRNVRFTGLAPGPYEFGVTATNAIGTSGPTHSGWVTAPGVVAWGYNDDGQAAVPSGLHDVTAIAAASAFSLALHRDGTVTGWGAPIGRPPAGLGRVVELDATGSHTLALRADGTVVAWGWNGFGQTSVPAGLRHIVAVAAGGLHSLALKADGTVVAWGGAEGVQVPRGLRNVVAISAGHQHSLALCADGTVVAWGSNQFGQATVPLGLGDVVAISAGNSHNLVLQRDGTVIGWGDNAFGQATTPPGLSGVTAISAGGAHSLALRADGTVTAWGWNSSGQTKVPANLAAVKQIAAGKFHSIVLVRRALSVALVTGNAARLPQGDMALTKIMASAQQQVRRLDDDALSSPTARRTIAGADVVVVSSSVRPNDAGVAQAIEQVLRRAPTPVVVLEPYAARGLGMVATGQGKQVVGEVDGQTRIDIVDPQHAIARAVQLAATSVDVTTRATTLAWYAPVADARVVARVPLAPGVGAASGQAAVFTLETGAALGGRRDNAPARRVGMFATYDTTRNLSGFGSSWFLAALDHAAGTT